MQVNFFSEKSKFWHYLLFFITLYFFYWYLYDFTLLSGCWVRDNLWKVDVPENSWLLKIDNKIPGNHQFIIFYAVAYYPTMVLFFLSFFFCLRFLKKNNLPKKDFFVVLNKTLFIFIVFCLVSALFHTFFPLGVSLINFESVKNEAKSNWFLNYLFEKFASFENENDSLNAFPSNHISSQVVCVYFVFAFIKKFKTKEREREREQTLKTKNTNSKFSFFYLWLLFLIFLTVMTAISTFVIKAHFFIDVIFTFVIFMIIIIMCEKTWKS